jgi:4-carboxymuconolactone decarboxylase
MSPKTRLPLLPPASLSPDQKDLYDDMAAVIDDNFGELIARRKDGALIGPFNGWLHFPQFGKPAWAFNKSLWEHSVLPAAIHQLVILVTAAKFGARYEIYGHEYFARRAGSMPRCPDARNKSTSTGGLDNQQAPCVNIAAWLTLIVPVRARSS